MNFLVETKNEYTIQLINILSPHLFEGFESIYNESKKIIKKGEEKKVLKAFQQFIKRIPSWNSNLIENETTRIRTASRCDFLQNLLKAVIKANIILLSNTNQLSSNISIEKKYLDIPLHKFIHRCYVECARQFYNSPYLFYHDIRPIEKKRNQRDCFDIIKQGIKEAIRKILPVQHILDQYLGSNMKFGRDEIDKPISAVESENLKQLISKDLTSGNENVNDITYSKEDNNNNFMPSQLADKMTEIKSNNIDDIEQLEGSSDDETVNLLSEIKRNIINTNEVQQGGNIEQVQQQNAVKIDNEDHFNQMVPRDSEKINLSSDKSENINSVPITNYYSENRNKLDNELRESENRVEIQAKKHEDIINQINDLELEANKSDKIENRSRNTENKHLDSESSALFIGNDDDYEDVFSNVNDSYISEGINKKKSINNKKMRDAYFSRFNGL